MQENLKPQAAPEPVRMTAEEWRRRHRNFKGTYQGRRYVLRMTPKGTAMVNVEIVKEQQK